MLWFGCGAHTNRTRPADMTAHAEVVAPMVRAQDRPSLERPVDIGFWPSLVALPRAAHRRPTAVRSPRQAEAAGPGRRPSVERSFGRLKENWALAPLRVPRIERVRLHTDLTILSQLTCALSRERGLGGRGVVPRSATLAQGFQVGRLRGDPSAEPKEGVAKLRNPFVHAGLRGRVGGR
jgi:hypothetical protein